MKNLEEIIDAIEKEINEKDSVKEQTLRHSRMIIINCRKAIQRMHQNQFNQAKELIHSTGNLIISIHENSDAFPEILSSGFVENATQEYAEASCLYHILQKKDIPGPEQLHISNTSYLMGLCDVVGELRRKTLDALLKGNFTTASELLEIMEAIYDAILRFDYPSSLVPIKRKQDVSRMLIEKTRGELAISSCEQRITSKTEEFKQYMDSIKNKEKGER